MKQTNKKNSYVGSIQIFSGRLYRFQYFINTHKKWMKCKNIVLDGFKKEIIKTINELIAMHNIELAGKNFVEKYIMWKKDITIHDGKIKKEFDYGWKDLIKANYLDDYTKYIKIENIKVKTLDSKKYINNLYMEIDLSISGDGDNNLIGLYYEIISEITHKNLLSFITNHLKSKLKKNSISVNKKISRNGKEVINRLRKMKIDVDRIH